MGDQIMRVSKASLLLDNKEPLAWEGGGQQSQVSDGFLRAVLCAPHAGPTLGREGRRHGIWVVRGEEASALLPQGGVRTQERT